MHHSFFFLILLLLIIEVAESQTLLLDTKEDISLEVMPCAPGFYCPSASESAPEPCIEGSEYVIFEGDNGSEEFAVCSSSFEPPPSSSDQNEVVDVSYIIQLPLLINDSHIEADFIQNLALVGVYISFQEFLTLDVSADLQQQCQNQIQFDENQQPVKIIECGYYYYDHHDNDNESTASSSSFSSLTSIIPSPNALSQYTTSPNAFSHASLNTVASSNASFTNNASLNVAKYAAYTSTSASKIASSTPIVSADAKYDTTAPYVISSSTTFKNSSTKPYALDITSSINFQAASYENTTAYVTITSSSSSSSSSSSFSSSSSRTFENSSTEAYTGLYENTTQNLGFTFTTTSKEALQVHNVTNTSSSFASVGINSYTSPAVSVLNNDMFISSSSAPIILSAHHENRSDTSTEKFNLPNMFTNKSFTSYAMNPLLHTSSSSYSATYQRSVSYNQTAPPHVINTNYINTSSQANLFLTTYLPSSSSTFQNIESTINSQALTIKNTFQHVQNYVTFAENNVTTSIAENKLTTSIAENNLTTSIAENNLTTSIAQNNLNTSTAENNMTTSIPQNNETSSIAQNNLTTSIAQNYLNTSTAENNMTTSIAQNNVTTSIAENNVTTSIAENNVTTSTAENNVTTSLPQNNATVTQDKNATTSTGEDNPKDNTTVEENYTNPSPSCSPGTFYSQQNQTRCLPCPLGHYCNGTKADPIACSPASYSPWEGSSSCLACPPFSSMASSSSAFTGASNFTQACVYPRYITMVPLIPDSSISSYTKEDLAAQIAAFYGVEPSAVFIIVE